MAVGAVLFLAIAVVGVVIADYPKVAVPALAAVEAALLVDSPVAQEQVGLAGRLVLGQV